MFSVCSFRNTLVSSFCALSFWALILVGFLLLHKEAFFTYACFFLTAEVSHETLDLALCFVGMHSAAASKWALTKFSYSSFGVGVSDISWSASNVFLSVNVYFSQISLLLSRAAFLHRLSSIFAVIIWWSEDTSLKEENAIQCTIIPFLIYENVVYLYFSILYVGVGL